MSATLELVILTRQKLFTFEKENDLYFLKKYLHISPGATIASFLQFQIDDMAHIWKEFIIFIYVQVQWFSQKTSDCEIPGLISSSFAVPVS